MIPISSLASHLKTAGTLKTLQWYEHQNNFKLAHVDVVIVAYPL